MNDSELKNRRVLIIDDNEAIHKDFRAILQDFENDKADLAEEKTALFGESAESSKVTFQVDSALQGQEGLEKIRQALLEGKPYAMAFVDVRMPPGWDGIETVQKIWMEYPDLQVVICTAYSDYSWHDIINELGETEKLLILKKPFDNVEVYQIASAMTQKWVLCQQAKLKYEELERIVKQKTYQLQLTNNELENANKELTSALKEAEKAERAKSEFLANMSHEIRTPLNSVIGFSDILFEEELSNEQKEYVGYIRQSSRNLMQIINDILDFSKIEAGRLDLDIIDCSVQEILDDIQSMFRLQAQEKGLEFKMLIDSKLPETIRTDPGRLRQCLLNLVGNALKFTDKGHVYICASWNQDADEHPFVTFEVQDTGIGIAAAKQKGIFDSFSQVDYSTTRNYGGTGLGLAITKRLVELLGGRVSLQSNEGHGSTFTIEVPVSIQVESRAVPQTTQADTVCIPADITNACFTGSILVGEDMFTNQDLVKQLLQNIGVKSRYCCNRDRKFLIMLNNGLSILFLWDMKNDGYGLAFDVTKRLRAQGYTYPVVALIDDTEGQDKASFKAGCNDYLRKTGLHRKIWLRLLLSTLPIKEKVTADSSN